MNALVKKFAKDHFPDAKSDLFACFIERGYTLAKDAGYNAMVTMQSWMFLSSFEKMRERMLREKTICTMAHLGAWRFRASRARQFGQQRCAAKSITAGLQADFFRLLRRWTRQRSERRCANSAFETFRYDSPRRVQENPRQSVAYWVGQVARDNYSVAVLLEQIAVPKQGATTSDNDRFLRFWAEIPSTSIGFEFSTRERASASDRKWFPYNKGGQFRRWYGNQDFVVNFKNDGEEIRVFHDILNKTSPGGRLKNQDCYFKQQLSWSKISSGLFSIRLFPFGFIFDVAGSALFPDNREDMAAIAGMLNSKVSAYYLKALSPTLNYEAEHLRKLPYVSVANAVFDHLVALSKSDWDLLETSWDFQSFSILTVYSEPTPTIESSYTAWITQNRETIAEMRRLEEKNNHLFIDAYGLADELTPDVPIEEITLTVNPAYRYGGKLTEEEQWTRFRKDTMAELVSYAIGCMMGRYSLDAPGLIYAHSGNVGFDASRYTTFPADPDGIVPLTDSDWFDDDAAHRLIEFISVAWDAARLEANLAFLANNLSPKKNEPSRETLRRYLCDSFFKDHLQTYKKRPIYWLFSSGKQKAFQCLVYLHRYNEGTLARMRTEYVIPLQGMMASRVRQLEGDIAVAASTAHRRRLEKERETLVKQQSELREFDEKLRHYADQRIGLDLDDGVKVNYGKFGGLLAEVKAITGAKAD